MIKAGGWFAATQNVQQRLANLEVHLSYCFNLKTTKDQMDNVKNRLAHVKGSGIDPAKYGALISELNQIDHVYVGTVPFIRRLTR